MLKYRWLEQNEKYLIANNCTILHDSIEMPIPGLKDSIILSEDDIKKLDSCGLPSHNEFIFFENYGFSYRKYSEVFLTFETPIDQFVLLPFSIGSIHFVLSDYSYIAYSLLTDYFESASEIYHDVRFMNDYNISLKIINSPLEDILINTEKAMFYINSHYIRKLNNANSIFDLTMSWDSNNSDCVITRTRIRKRKDFHNIIPLKLYNYACNQRSDSQFLSFYRILEYYFPYTVDAEICKIRQDKSIENKNLLKKLKELQSEKESLSLLFKQVVSNSDLEYFQNLLLKNKMYENKNVVSNQLYQFRCSLVHAKSDMEELITIPDFRETDKAISIWSIIVRNIAEKCIKIFEEK